MDCGLCSGRGRGWQAVWQWLLWFVVRAPPAAEGRADWQEPAAVATQDSRGREVEAVLGSGHLLKEEREDALTAQGWEGRWCGAECRIQFRTCWVGGICQLCKMPSRLVWDWGRG